MKDIKFVIIILIIFFGVGIMAEINDYDYSINKRGVMYQENDNIVLNQNKTYYDYDIDFNFSQGYLQYNPVKKYSFSNDLIESMVIKFNGTNQIEYIHPYKFYTIEINDIKNVNNIEFELLNTTNPAVFNWSITTNPNIPFVKFYNEQTKLLYDFTDVDEMNDIGNSLVGSRSSFTRVFNGVIDLIDTFYQGFQKIFSKKNIQTLYESLKNNWPLLPPNWPWLRR